MNRSRTTRNAAARLLATTLLMAGLSHCGSSDETQASAVPNTEAGADSEMDAGTDDAVDAVDDSPKAVTVTFERVAGSREFDVIARVQISATGASPPTYSADWPVQVTSDRGSVGEVQATSLDGAPAFRARVTPDATGRHLIMVQVVDTVIEAERTALVLPTVGDDWNQPEPVAGLVNTRGWEDGANISPDGQWLLIQYLPVPIDCVVGMDPAAPVCAKAVGPVQAPERPNMPGASRVASDGTITNGCPSLGVPDLPIPVPPNTLYAFRRTTDAGGVARFEEPHPIYWGGADGCVSSFGPALLDMNGNDASLLYAFDSPVDNSQGETGGDLFVAQVTLGADIELGRATVSGGALALADHIGVPVGDATEGHQGNPWGWRRPGGGYAVFYDDEATRQDLFVIETNDSLAAGTWTPSALLPAPVSVDGQQESQPFFDGSTLYFRRGLTILSSAWNGGAWSDPASWGPTQAVLGDDLTASAAGEILGEGEPTIAETPAGRELYFVFVEKAPDGTLNLDIGMVPSR